LIPPVEVNVVPPTPLVKVLVLLIDPATRDPDTFNDPPVTFKDPIIVVLDRVDAPTTFHEPPLVTVNDPAIIAVPFTSNAVVGSFPIPNLEFELEPILT
jgi:hypothetical protein